MIPRSGTPVMLTLSILLGSVNLITAVPIASATAEGSINFDGTNGILYSGGDGANMGTDDFTWEAWVNPTRIEASFPAILDSRLPNNTNNGLALVARQVTAGDTTVGYLAVVNAGGEYGDLQMPRGALTVGQWQHIAFVRQSGKGRIFVNGLSKGVGNFTADLTNSDFYVGRNQNPVNTDFNGKISNIRLVRGTALYTSANFATAGQLDLGKPSFQPLTAISGTTALIRTLFDAVGTSWRNVTAAAGKTAPTTIALTGTPTSNSDHPEMPITPSLTLTLPSDIRTATYGTTTEISAQVSTAGTVTFKAGGTAICSGVAISVTATCSWTPSAANAALVLTADFTPTNPIYSTLTGAGGLSINVGKAALAITASSPTVSYASSSPAIVGSYSGLIGADTNAVVVGLVCSSGTYSTTSAVGTTPATNCSGGSSSNYEISYVAGSITIVKARPTFTWSGATKSYGGSDFKLTPPTTAVAGTFSYSSASTNVISINAETATVGVVGTSLITATFTPSDLVNYFADETATMTLQVDRAPLTVTASSPTVTYGDATPAVTPTFATFIGGDSSAVVTGLTCSSPTYTNTSAVGSTPATTCSGGSASNYSLSYTSGLVTINKSSQPNDLILTSTLGTYGTNLTLAASGGLGGGALSYSVISGPCSLSPSGLELVSSAAGTCSVQVSRAASTNYDAGVSAATNVVIGKKSLSISGITGVSKEYDGNRNAAQATGTPTLNGIVGVDAVTLSGTPVFVFDTADVGSSKTVTASGYSLTNSNYILVQPNVSANITAKPLTVTASNRTFGFGDTVTAVVSATGLVSPDSISGATFTFSTGTNTPPTASGTSSITPSLVTFLTGSASNYSITYVSGTLEILAAFTVTLDPKLGVVSPTSLVFAVGGTPLTLPASTRANYFFEGWYDEGQSPAVKVSAANYVPTSDKTLVAHWTQYSLKGLSSPQIFGEITATAGNDGGISATRSGTKAEVEYFADSLPLNTKITAYLQGSTAYAASQLSGVTNLLLSVVVAWKAPDETVPSVDPTKNAILLKITNPSIKRGAKVYSIIGDSSTVLTTATQDGFVVIELREDPEIVIANPVEIPAPPAPAPPAPSAPSIIAAPIIDNSVAESAAKLKADEGVKKAAEFKITQEQAAKDLQAAREKAAAEIKAAQDAADLDAKLKAEANARIAAELKAKEDAAIAAKLASQKIVPDVTLYSISPSLKLSVYDATYLKNYVATLKPKATVTCIGYIYTKGTTISRAKSSASKQATAVCKLIKAQRKSLTTKVVIYPASKAPKAAAGAKWVAVSYRVDGFKS
jgi:uncharacterized repeat protein (TIGR02543 family)